MGGRVSSGEASFVMAGGEAQGPFGCSGHWVRPALVGRFPAQRGDRGLAERAGAAMDGPGGRDDLVRDHGRPFGPGPAGRLHPLGLPDADRDAVFQAGGAPPHPVSPDGRAPDRGTERLEPVRVLGPVQRVYRDDQDVREDAHRGDGRGHADRGGRGAGAQGKQDL